MSGKAATIRLSEEHLEILRQMERSTTVSHRLHQRARVILLGFDGLLNTAIAEEVGLPRKQVGQWRMRWRQSFDALVAIECREPRTALRRAIEDILSDAPRSGAPGKFTAEQITLILAVGCESTEQSGRPIATWTGRELTDRPTPSPLEGKNGQAAVNLAKLWLSWASNCDLRY